MRVTFDRKSLLAAAEVLLPCIPKRDTKPILRAFLLTCADGQAELAATDLDVGCRCELAAAADEDGGVLVVAEPLVKLLRELPEEEIALEEEVGCVRLEAAKSSIKLPHLGDVKHYPDIPRLADVPCHEADAALLRHHLDAVRWIVPTPSEGLVVEKYYRGARALQWLVGADGRLHLTATDGHVLGTASLPLAGQPELPFKASEWPLLPGKAMQLLSGVLARATAEGATCKIRLQKQDALFQAAGCTLYSRLCEGKYPDWINGWTKEPTTDAVVDRDALLSALRQAAVLWDDLEHFTTLRFTAGLLTVASRPGERGSASVELACRYGGSDSTWVFQGPLLLELVRALPAGDVTLGLVSSMKQLPVAAEDGVRYIAVPCAPPREPEPVKRGRRQAEPAAV